MLFLKMVFFFLRFCLQKLEDSLDAYVWLYFASYVKKTKSYTNDSILHYTWIHWEWKRTSIAWSLIYFGCVSLRPHLYCFQYINVFVCVHMSYLVSTCSLFFDDWMKILWFSSQQWKSGSQLMSSTLYDRFTFACHF